MIYCWCIQGNCLQLLESKTKKCVSVKRTWVFIMTADLRSLSTGGPYGGGGSYEQMTINAGFTLHASFPPQALIGLLRQ